MLGRLFRQNSQSSISNQQPNSNIKQPPFQNPHPKIPHHSSGSNVNSYEDSYTRSNLYGTPDSSSLKPYHPNQKFFRIIIAQDGGSLRSKQVLYDSSSSMDHNQNPSSSWQLNSNPNQSSPSSKNPKSNLSAKNILTSKIYHNASELNDYMFGCGLPTNESASSTKMHILPTLNNSIYGSYLSVLITKLFLIPSATSETNTSNPTTNNEDDDSTWLPHPSIPIKETTMKNLSLNLPSRRNSSTSLISSTSSSPSQNSNSLNYISSRFSIGIIIPIESIDDDIADIIYNNWDEITHFLIVLQKIVSKKLISALNNSISLPPLLPSPTSLNSTTPNSSPFIIKKRIQFPSYILQNDHELNGQLFKLIKLLHYNSNIPKLINSNSLIKHSILNPTTSNFSPILINWILEIINWLEFKDGKSNNSNQSSNINFNYNSQFHQDNASFSNHDHIQPSAHPTNNLNNSHNIGNTFLASLLALLIPLRQKLCNKPVGASLNNKQEKEITRVVIMTGNPMVAKKLIFIINALIPNDKFLVDLNETIVDLDIDDDNSLGHHENETNETSISNDDNDDDNKNTNEKNNFNDNIDNVTTTPKIKNSEFQQSNPPSPKLKVSPSSPSKFSSSNGKQVLPITPYNSHSTSPTKPIPIKNSGLSSSPVATRELSSSMSSNSSSLNRSASYSKGWEIPTKSGPSTSTTGKALPSRVETSSKNIPIAQESLLSERRSSQSKSFSMAYLSSSLNSSLSSSASNYSLSKLGGSFMEKWRNTLNSSAGNNTGTIGTPGGFGSSYQTPNENSGGSYNASNGYFNINHHANGVNINNNYNNSHNLYDSSEYVPHYQSGSLTKRSSVQSLRTPSPVVEFSIDESSNSQLNIGSLTPVSQLSSQAKLSRTQSMFDLYHMNNHNHNHCVQDKRFNVIQEGSPSHHPMLYHGHHQPQKEIVGLKRTKSSVITPILQARTLKNINEINKSRIETKCSKIMKANISYSIENQSDRILNVDSIDFTNHSRDSPDISVNDTDDSFHDENTVTSSMLNKSISVNSIKPVSERPLQLYKRNSLFPNVAFVDEFRPEFTVQSCPVNPKLESQVMTAMKNDLLFYQNNCEYEKVTSRTVFISLRAREIKLIEMNVGGEILQNLKNKSSSSQNNVSTLNKNPEETLSPSTRGNGGASVNQSPLSAYFKNSSNLPENINSPMKYNENSQQTSMTNSVSNSGSTSSSYKTTIKKIFTPNKSSGDKNLINTVETTLTEINKLFNPESQSKDYFQHNKQHSNDDHDDGNDFNEKLAILISNLLH